MKFRSDINALRALAVFVVVFFHYKVPNFNGGFAGVDIFFVISGYLMSKIILTGFENSSFSLFEFYKKRFVRIVPPLLFMIVLIQFLGSFILWPSEQKLLSKYALSSELFLSNIFYYMKSGYFDASAENNPLLHTWSLSVEWQFYLIYPILLLVLNKYYKNNRTLFKRIVITLLVLSFIISMWYSRYDSNWAFYSFPTRAWEMLIGCLIVLYEKKFCFNIPAKIRGIMVIVSFLAIAIFIVVFKSSTGWPNFYTLIPVLGTTIIILCNSSYKIYNTQAIQLLGKISYSLYLWHWPLYVFLVGFGYEGIYAISILLAVVLLLSSVSYKYIETNRNIFSSLRQRISYTSLIILFSLTLQFIHINEYLIDDKILKLVNYQNKDKEEQFNTGKCYLYSKSQYEDFSSQECLSISDTKRNILLIGDSHAAQFSLNLNEYLDSLNMNLLQATTSYCYPFLNPRGRDENAKLVEYVLTDFIPEHSSKIDLVIISANWVDNQVYSNDELQIKIVELINYLKQNNIKVKMIGQTENYSNPFPFILGKQLSFSFFNTDNFVNRESYDMNEYLKSFISEEIYIDVYNILDDKMSSDYEPYMFDNNHLTTWGTLQYIPFLINKGLLE